MSYYDPKTEKIINYKDDDKYPNKKLRLLNDGYPLKEELDKLKENPVELIKRVIDRNENIYGKELKTDGQKKREILQGINPLLEGMHFNQYERLVNRITTQRELVPLFNKILPDMIELKSYLQEQIQEAEENSIQLAKQNQLEEDVPKDITENIASFIGGKKRKTKKVRKHKGIIQTGGNTGRLRKGYRYSGKKLKSGLPQIIKCKSKKC
jgi:hypothetical protein